MNGHFKFKEYTSSCHLACCDLLQFRWGEHQRSTINLLMIIVLTLGLPCSSGAGPVHSGDSGVGGDGDHLRAEGELERCHGRHAEPHRAQQGRLFAAGEHCYAGQHIQRRLRIGG